MAADAKERAPARSVPFPAHGNRSGGAVVPVVRAAYGASRPVRSAGRHARLRLIVGELRRLE